GNGLEQALKDMVDAGLWGLECLHPDYEEAQTEVLLDAADRHSLARTAGSDCHGAGKPGIALGRGQVSHPFCVPVEWGQTLVQAVQAAETEGASA
ncbi:hypothetical protein KIPB_003715, partial [Kipferlia bialata]